MILRLAMVVIPHQTEQLGHARVLAKDDIISYMHVHNTEIIFVFEVWDVWVGQARETTNQVEVALCMHIQILRICEFNHTLHTLSWFIHYMDTLVEI